MVIVSVDEKPGIQALRSIAAELPPVPGQYQGIGRDYEYERLGTFSLLAGLDLHSGYVHGLVEERHRENSTPIILEIVAFGSSLTITVRTFPKRPWNGLSIYPGRFEYVHTPTHGSWLNIIENAI